MNRNPDYNVSMLKLYFIEKGFTEKEKQNILRYNPFNEIFVRWENDQIYTNRIIAEHLKIHGLIKMDDNIHEIVNDTYNSIGRYLFNHITYSDNIKDFIARDDIVLVRDTINDHYSYIEELAKLPNRCISGICTKNRALYEKKLLLYKQLLEEYRDLKMYENTKKDLSICLIKKCR